MILHRLSRQIAPVTLCGLFLGAFIVIAMLLPPATSSQASEALQRFEGRVIRVSDGDSITVRAGEINVRIRLAEIDAPERGQAWGTRSKQELEALVAGKIVTIVPQGQDRYGRTIAYVKLGEQDISRTMITRGAAWAYRDFLRDPSIIAIEQTAKRSGTGLWAMPEQERLAPWIYRARQRESASVVVGR
jgi:endonuclease YncB( thermonuclease family)